VFPAKRALAALAATVVIIAGVSGCATSQSQDCRQFPAGDASNAVEVTGDFGAAISLTVPETKGVSGVQRTVAIQGDGEAPESGVTIDVQISLFSGNTGGTINSLRTNFRTSDNTLPTPVRAGIECLPVGSRSVTVFPAGDLFSASQLAEANLQVTEPVVMVADILGADEVPTVYPWDTGLPTVVPGVDGVPTISLGDASRPAGIHVAVIKQGDGMVIAATDTVEVNYLGVEWTSGKVFDGNFGSEPAEFFLANVIEGFRLGLVGQKVGSEVLVSIPAKFAYGESSASSSNPLAGQDLLFLIRVLGATPATSSTK